MQDRGAPSRERGAQGGVEGRGGNSTNHPHREAGANLASDRITRVSRASLECQKASQRRRGGEEKGRTCQRKVEAMPPQDAPSSCRLRTHRGRPCLYRMECSYGKPQWQLGGGEGGGSSRRRRAESLPELP